MKIFNVLFALIFLSFAALQYNDPDPILWILIYGAMATVCVFAAMGKVHLKLLIALGALYLVYAIILFPSALTWIRSDDRSLLFDDLAKMQFPYIEETREFLGLTICLLVLVIHYFSKPKLNS